jgi:hypothetical protein
MSEVTRCRWKRNGPLLHCENECGQPDVREIIHSDPERWPKRVCRSPKAGGEPAKPAASAEQIKEAYDRLALPLDQQRGTIRHVLDWIKAGMPERSADEQVACEAACKGCDEHHVEANETFPEQCLFGCKKLTRDNKPPLVALRKMATFECSAKLWNFKDQTAN